MKNWDLFESRPELAMATIPRALNYTWIRRGESATRWRQLYLECGSDFVWKGTAPDALASFAWSRRIASLDHERFNASMEYAAIVVVWRTKREKVLAMVLEAGQMLWECVSPRLLLEQPHRRFQSMGRVAREVGGKKWDIPWGRHVSCAMSPTRHGWAAAGQEREDAPWQEVW